MKMKKFIRKGILLFIVLYFGMFGINCKKNKTSKADEPNKDFKYASIIGSWKMIPSEGLILIFEPDGKVYLVKKSNRKEFFLKIDSLGARIQESKEALQPEGYFLFSEQKKDSWYGIWKDEMVRLQKIMPVNSRESILE